ncbi:MAG: exosortase A [Burkholderiales bacterium]|nr:exosortase A [Burkholderiales bacterium]
MTVSSFAHENDPGRTARLVSLAFFAAGLLVVAWTFRDTWASMERVWRNSDTFAHGYLIPVLSLWMVWKNRAALAQVPLSWGWLGIPWLAGCAAVWLVGELSGVNVVAQFGVVGMIPGIVLLMLGHRMAWQLLFPLAFLFFMVPFGEALDPILMEWTADATVAALTFSGIPIYRDGLHFMIPTGRWSVVEACSGLRYIIAALILALLFSYLNFTSWTKRAVFVLGSLVVAIIANWARAYLVVMIGHLTHMRYGAGDDHVWYGWIFFGIVMLLVFYAGQRWQDPDPFAAKKPSGPRPAAQSRLRLGSLLAALVLIVAMTGVRALPDALAHTEPSQAAANDLVAAMGAAPRGQLSIQPGFHGAAKQWMGAIGPEPAVEFYSAYFFDQRKGVEMIAYNQRVLSTEERHWSVSSAQPIEIVDAAGETFSVIEYRLRAGTDEALLWHWYTVAGQRVTSPYRVKLATLEALLLGHGDHSTIDILFSRVGVDEAATRQRLSAAAARLATASRQLTRNGRADD